MDDGTALAIRVQLPAPEPVPAALAGGTPWPAVVDAYLAAAIDSDHTRRAYRRHLTNAFTAIGAATVADISGAQLAGYRASVTSSALAPASQGQALAALRAFLRWSGSMGAHTLPADVIATALRTPKAAVQRPYQVLTEPEIAATLAAAVTSRDRALLAVLLGSGLRVAEAVALDVPDLIEDADGGMTLYVRQGKGRKDRQVPVRADVAGLLRTYLTATDRRLGDTGALFRAHDRGVASRSSERARLTERAVAYLVKRTTERAGVTAKSLSPHSLRHTFGIRSLRAGGNVVAVSKLLGHASITTTQKYVDHLAVSELRSAIPPLPGG